VLSVRAATKLRQACLASNDGCLIQVRMFQAFLTARHTPLITCCACAARWCAGGAATCTATSQPSCCSSARLRVLLLQGRLSRSRAWARRSGLRQRGGGPMRAGRYCACTFSRTGERRERTRWHSGTRCGAALADKSCGLLAGAPVGCFDKQASGFESSACLPCCKCGSHKHIAFGWHSVSAGTGMG